MLYTGLKRFRYYNLNTPPDPSNLVEFPESFFMYFWKTIDILRKIS